jgi:hypothetical protein
MLFAGYGVNALESATLGTLGPVRQADLRRVFAPTISAAPPNGGVVHPPRAFPSGDRAPNQGARPMLSEIFILRLEALLRASNEPSPASIATRFVPIKPPASPIKHLQPAGK